MKILGVFSLFCVSVRVSPVYLCKTDVGLVTEQQVELKFETSRYMYKMGLSPILDK